MIEFGNFYQLIAKIISPTGWNIARADCRLATRAAAWLV